MAADTAPPEAPDADLDTWEHFPPGTAQRVMDCWLTDGGEQQIAEWAAAIGDTCSDAVIDEAFRVLDIAEQLWERQVQAARPRGDPNREGAR